MYMYMYMCMCICVYVYVYVYVHVYVHVNMYVYVYVYVYVCICVYLDKISTLTPTSPQTPCAPPDLHEPSESRVVLSEAGQTRIDRPIGGRIGTVLMLVWICLCFLKGVLEEQGCLHLAHGK